MALRRLCAIETVWRGGNYFMRSDVFCSSARSLGWPSFSLVESTHFFSSAFLVGRSFW